MALRRKIRLSCHGLGMGPAGFGPVCLTSCQIPLSQALPDRPPPLCSSTTSILPPGLCPCRSLCSKCVPPAPPDLCLTGLVSSFGSLSKCHVPREASRRQTPLPRSGRVLSRFSPEHLSLRSPYLTTSLSSVPRVKCRPLRGWEFVYSLV